VTTASSTPPPSSGIEAHHARKFAESFGSDATRYDRVRPRYPQELVERVVAASPGRGPDRSPEREVLDVGIGTGILARAFRSAGCQVSGVDPDRRMADYARSQGFDVDVATFEEWDAANRSFDAIVAGQTWHWVDPAAGAAKAARLLRPGGRLAVFWNTQEFPPPVRRALDDAFNRTTSDGSDPRPVAGGAKGFSGFFGTAADGMRQTEALGEPEQWVAKWRRSFTRDEWLEVLATGVGFNQLPPERLALVLGELGSVVDAMGGTVTVDYTTVAVTAARADST
jgi:SAM-dependent methyltransferase